jgi:protein TonB
MAASQRGEREEGVPRVAPKRPPHENGHANVRAESEPSPPPPRRPSPGRRRDGLAARIFGVMGVSLGVHMALLAVLGFMPRPTIDEHKLVEMEITEPEPPPPPPPPPAAEEPPKPPQEEPAKPKAPPKVVAAPKPAEPPPQAPPKAAAETPVDLTGVTLTGDDGASWSSVVGNGQAMTGPAARIGVKTGRDKAGSPQGVVGGKGNAPALVPEASLARKPVAPEGMDALLEQFFPARARAQGVSGSALLRVRIMSDGRVGEMQTLRETGDYGFGSACMKALRQRRWQPPLDKAGQPVSTEIRYSCEFEVSY